MKENFVNVKDFHKYQTRFNVNIILLFQIESYILLQRIKNKKFKFELKSFCSYTINQGWSCIHDGHSGIYSEIGDSFFFCIKYKMFLIVLSTEAGNIGRQGCYSTKGKRAPLARTLAFGY